MLYLYTHKFLFLPLLIPLSTVVIGLMSNMLNNLMHNFLHSLRNINVIIAHAILFLIYLLE